MENTTSFQDLAESITDPRQQAKVMYPLDELLLLSLCGVVSGCESFVDIALYGEEKLEFLREPAPFANGIPSHDTLSTVFRALDPQEFSVAFSRWAAGLAGRVEGAIVAIDGKTARGSATGGETPLHMISAWCGDRRIVLGQQVCRHGSNEIADIPELLDLLSIEGATVTLDAMGCQREIAARIREKGADYVLTLKANQGTLHDDVKLWFEEREHENVQSHQTVDGDRGVVEIRTCTQCDDIGWLRERHPGWRDLTGIGRVVLVRDDDDGKTRPRTRYFISSLALDAKFLAHAVRSHWKIENGLHWVLDVSFREDDGRVRRDNGPANLAVIRHAAMNVLRRSRGRISLRGMRKKAGWNDRFLLELLAA